MEVFRGVLVTACVDIDGTVEIVGLPGNMACLVNGGAMLLPGGPVVVTGATRSPATALAGLILAS